MNFGIALDIALILLMAATIGYCVVLNRKLQTLRDSQAEMAKLVAAFDRATVQVGHGLQEFRAAGAKAGEIGQKLERAKAMLAELSFVIETGERLADRLANGPRASAHSSLGGASADPGISVRAADQAAGASELSQIPRTESERELLHALRGVR
jgi:hypothetical protein